VSVNVLHRHSEDDALLSLMDPPLPKPLLQIMISDLEGVRRFVPSRLYDQAPSRDGSHHAQQHFSSRGGAEHREADLYLDHSGENAIEVESDRTFDDEEGNSAAYWAEERGGSLSSAVVALSATGSAGKKAATRDYGDDGNDGNGGDDGDDGTAFNAHTSSASPCDAEDAESAESAESGDSALLGEDVYCEAATNLTEENLVCSFQSGEAEAESFSVSPLGNRRHHPQGGGDPDGVRTEDAEGDGVGVGEPFEAFEGTSPEQQLCSVCEEAFCSCLSSASWVGSIHSSCNVEDSFSLVKHFYEPADRHAGLA
jgi:hypothetical protein